MPEQRCNAGGRRRLAHEARKGADGRAGARVQWTKPDLAQRYVHGANAELSRRQYSVAGTQVGRPTVKQVMMAEKVTIRELRTVARDAVQKYLMAWVRAPVITDRPQQRWGLPLRQKRQLSQMPDFHETTQTYGAFLWRQPDNAALRFGAERWMSKALRLCSDGRVLVNFIDWRNLASVVDAMQVSGVGFPRDYTLVQRPDMRPVKELIRRNIEFIAWELAALC